MKKVLVLMAGILFAAANLYAGNGDLIVNGNLGVGAANPTLGKIQIQQPTSDYALYIENTWGTAPSTAAKGLFVRTAGNDGDDIILNLQGYNTDVMRVLGNGSVGIGITSLDPTYKLTINGKGLAFEGFWENSDIKLKKNILPVEGALDKILKLNGVSYEWKQDKDFEGETLEVLKADEDGNIKDDKYRNLPEGRTLGVIAQELENVLPEAVNTGEDGIKAVSYTKMIPVLIEAMKEQQKQITGQQKRIEELEKKVAQLK